MKDVANYLRIRSVKVYNNYYRNDVQVFFIIHIHATVPIQSSIAVWVSWVSELCIDNFGQVSRPLFLLCNIIQRVNDVVEAYGYGFKCHRWCCWLYCSCAMWKAQHLQWQYTKRVLSYIACNTHSTNYTKWLNASTSCWIRSEHKHHSRARHNNKVRARYAFRVEEHAQSLKCMSSCSTLGPGDYSLKSMTKHARV